MMNLNRTIETELNEHIIKQALNMESYMHVTDRTVELEDSLIAWQDKYDRLHESHKRVQKINQSLEDKLLRLVDRNSSERAQLTGDVATLSVRLAQANYNIASLQREIERYKADMGLAIQLLQCKPESFVPQKVTSLPQEVQSKVSQYMRLDTNSHSDSEGSTSGVGITTATSYHALPASDSPVPSCPFVANSAYPSRGTDISARNDLANNNNEQMISAEAMAKYLDDKLKASEQKHCDTCSCANKDLTVLADTTSSYNIGTQTYIEDDTTSNLLCLRCSSTLYLPSRADSPFDLKILKSSDSVISETKSSVSINISNDKLCSRTKKDDLVVNPILGHHRLCDRSSNSVSKFLDHSNNTNNNNMLMIDTQSKMKSPVQGNSREFSLNKTDTSSIDNKNGSLRNSIAMAGSSYSMSSRASSQTDGAKLFESFNRNLIRSIKADNSKVAGPRLCALRIQNGSSNVLLDNMESESCPILYTQRCRFLDEELNEDKDIITSQSESGVQQEKKLKISMLMTDGVDCKADVAYAQILKPTTVNSYVGSTLCNSVGIDTQMNLHTGNQLDSNQLKDRHDCTNFTNPYADIRDSQNQYNKYDLELESVSNRCGNRTDLSQCQSSNFMPSEVEINDNATFRRQQLTRVAQWIQNNQVMDNGALNSSTEALSIDSGYKTKLTNSGNSAIIDRESSSQKSTSIHFSSNIHVHSDQLDVSLIDNDETKLDIRNYCAQSNMNNNIDGTDKALAQVDLAQMEYNVKQFLLKQNEWANSHQNLNQNINTTNSLMNCLTDNDQSPTRRRNRNIHRTETNL